MSPIRQIVDDMPEWLPIPNEIRHKRVEVIFWPLEEPSSPGSFKQWLTSMPQVGEDTDFERIQDFGRRDEPWDS
jgi:hypothetical protein